MVNLVCDQCGGQVKRYPSQTKRKRHFCDRECQSRWQSKKKARFIPKGTVLYTKDKQRTDWTTTGDSFIHKLSGHGHVHIPVVCKCGTRTTVRISSVLIGRSKRCGNCHRKPEWFRDARNQLSGLKLARKEAREHGNRGWRNGFGEGFIWYKNRLRQHEDKHLRDCFDTNRWSQIKTHDYFLKRDPILVRWFGLGRTSKPFVFEDIYAFEKAMRFITETGKLPLRKNQ